MNTHIMPELCTHAVLAVGFDGGKRTGGGTPAGTRPADYSFLVSKRASPNNASPTTARLLTDNGPAAQAAMKKARRTGITKC